MVATSAERIPTPPHFKPGSDSCVPKKIDCAMCPITLIAMTHAALAESDWSVDSINNDGAYAAGNLMVICVKANRAKGAKGFREVVELASVSAQGTVLGLTKREWARLACVMAGAANMTGARPLLPLLTRLPEDSRAPLYFVFQQMLLFSARLARERNRVMKVCVDCIPPPNGPPF
jgi:hypothetical protein